MYHNNRKSLEIYSILLLIMIIISAAILTRSVSASEQIMDLQNGCISCHDNLYYNYDTGKSFCLCAEQMKCTCCHGGDPSVFNEKEAHQEMVLYPTRGNPPVCLRCHPGDYDHRIETFAAKAGVSLIHPSSPTQVQAVHSSLISKVPVTTSKSIMLSLEPWRQAGLLVLAGLFFILIYIGYRCWKADCLLKK